MKLLNGLFLIIVFSLCGCKSDELSSGNFKLPLRSIDKFEIGSFYNADKIDMNYTATIDEDRKAISLNLPASLVTKNPDLEYIEFIPTIKISRGASVTPKNLETIKLATNPGEDDFIEYKVTSEDGHMAIYTLRWRFDFKYSGASILGYEFVDAIDPNTGEPYFFDNKTTWMKLPKSCFTYDNPIKKDELGNEIGQIRIRIILASDSKNAQIIQPEKSISETAAGVEYYTNATRLSVTEPCWVGHFFSSPLYTYTLVSEDGSKTKEYYFGLNWDDKK